MSHKRKVLSKLINDDKFRKIDAQEALDMSKTGAANCMLNTAMEILEEYGWRASVDIRRIRDKRPVENPIDNDTQ